MVPVLSIDEVFKKVRRERGERAQIRSTVPFSFGFRRIEFAGPMNNVSEASRHRPL